MDTDRAQFLFKHGVTNEQIAPPELPLGERLQIYNIIKILHNTTMAINTV